MRHATVRLLAGLLVAALLLNAGAATGAESGGLSLDFLLGGKSEKKAADKPGPTGRRPVSDETMTLNLPAIPFASFIKIISEQSGLNVVTSAQIGSLVVSVYLRDVTARQALNAVCEAYNLVADENERTRIIVIRDTAVAFFALEHVDAESIQTSVSALLGDGGKVSFDKTNNIVAVQGSPRGIDQVRTLLNRADRQPRQVLIESLLVEMGDDIQRQIGIRWEPSGFFRGSARQTKLPFKNEFVTLAESASAWTYGFINFQDFFVQLQFLQTTGDANILASPRIATLDGREAEIKIVTNTVVATELTREADNLDVVTEEPVYAEVGVTLKTTPRVHENNFITMTVEPSVSTASRAAFFEQAVDTFERSAKTTVMVKNGTTIAIGGLTRKNRTDTIRSIPYLGKMPLVGRVFRHKDRSGDKTDLIVFLTPRVQDLDKEAVETADVYKGFKNSMNDDAPK